MRATVCQLDGRADHFEVQWTALGAHLREKRSDFLLLPEMPFGDWLAASPDYDAARWQAAVTRHAQWLDRLPELGVPIVAGTRPVIDGTQRRNRAFLWQADAPLTEPHDKYYVPDEPAYWEAHWYQRADRPDFTTTDVGAMTVGFQVCTEIWFFEHARALGKQGVHLLLVPRATPHASIEKWLAGGRSAAVVSGAYCLSSNHHAPLGAPADLGGLGFVCDPEGEVLARTSEDTPFATVPIDLSFATAAKETYPRYVPD
jgi:N-carbamoylputrescine amidase